MRFTASGGAKLLWSLIRSKHKKHCRGLGHGVKKVRGQRSQRGGRELESWAPLVLWEAGTFVWWPDLFLGGRKKGERKKRKNKNKNPVSCFVRARHPPVFIQLRPRAPTGRLIIRSLCDGRHSMFMHNTSYSVALYKASWRRAPLPQLIPQRRERGSSEEGFRPTRTPTHARIWRHRRHIPLWLHACNHILIRLTHENL